MGVKMKNHNPTLQEKCSHTNATPHKAILIKRLEEANTMPDKSDAIIWNLLDIATNMSNDFLTKGLGDQSKMSPAKIKKVNKKLGDLFRFQNLLFTELVLRFPTHYAEGEPCYPIPPHAYASLIMVKASMEDKWYAEKEGRVFDFKEYKMYNIMKQAGYPVEAGIGIDMVDLLLDYGMMEIIEE